MVEPDNSKRIDWAGVVEHRSQTGSVERFSGNQAKGDRRKPVPYRNAFGRTRSVHLNGRST